jgi:LuxR family transcriptional regulator, maltose regulon positive regulatory protein
MRRQRAVVEQGRLYDPGPPSRSVRLDTPAWFAWLNAAASSSFSYALIDQSCGYIVGFVTVRKERRQRGGEYWAAFRRNGASIRKGYLGRASAVTAARLHTIAWDLYRPAPSRDSLG